MPRAEKASPGRMRDLFRVCGFELTDLQANLFWQYYLRLKARNQEINLTRIHRFEEVVIKHFVDSAMVGRLCALPSPLLDVGSGGGFPGVPLKILHPEVALILAEGRRLRAAFLEEIRRSLRLPLLYLYGRQVRPDYAEPVGGVVTRAVERIAGTLARVQGCLRKGGRAIFMKGPSVEPELLEAKEAWGASYALREDHAYLLPGTDHRRRLIVYERLDGPAS
ncbi:MAG: 16S rRNA (guanine(527)-N(7))-methyltransferase RsmG [Planctomycetota bacterium]